MVIRSLSFRNCKGSPFMSRAAFHPTSMLLPTFLVGLLALAAPGSAAEEALVVRWESGSTTNSATPLSSELRDALASAVIERNVIAMQRDALAQQRSMILIYAAIISLIAAWFIRAYLRKGTEGKTSHFIAPTTAPTRAPTKESKVANAPKALL